MIASGITESGVFWRRSLATDDEIEKRRKQKSSQRDKVPLIYRHMTQTQTEKHTRTQTHTHTHPHTETHRHTSTHKDRLTLPTQSDSQTNTGTHNQLHTELDSQTNTDDTHTHYTHKEVDIEQINRQTNILLALEVWKIIFPNPPGFEYQENVSFSFFYEQKIRTS